MAHVAGASTPPTGVDARALERRATEIAAERAEIHYHTFSGRSFRALLAAVAARHAPELRLCETVGNRREVIGVLTRG